jgi:hypothetical protein
VWRNYGMARPEGYRKGLRLMHLAEKFGLPLITLIDTPGAYPGIGAEERGQSEAIARNLFVMSTLKVPIISVVIGEGGSGGALAIGVADRVLMLQYSIYSVISPEGCASILYKSADKAEIAAEAMGITAERLQRLKLVDGKWIGEPVWTNPQTPMFMSSPVLIGGTIYGLTMRSRGQFVAIDAASGKTLWNTQGREGDNASIMGSPSWLLASTTDGNLVIARANSQKYEEVRRYQIAPSALWAHPAITGSSIIVKDADKVICWGF